MEECFVTVFDISITLRDFDLTYPGKDNGLTVIERFPNGRMLKVWVAEGSLHLDPLTVKSVAWEDHE
jgi:hypothetical protein